MVKSFLKNFRLSRSLSNPREEIQDLIREDGPSEETLDAHEKILLNNILGLRAISAADVMVPRADIIAVDLDEETEVIIKKMTTAGHSRLPVYQGVLDKVLGVLHIKDVTSKIIEGGEINIQELLRPAIFSSPSLRLLDLLQEMRLKRLHLSLVIDEFGGVDGLITIEDLVEEIVGEIEDEHDTTAQLRFDQKSDGTAIADARFEVETLEAITGPLLNDDERDEIDTLGGLVFSLAGRVPGHGEVVRHRAGIQFEILEGDPRRITLLKLRGLPRVASSAKQE